MSVVRARLLGLWRELPALRRLVEHVLDRRDAGGRFPRRLTVPLQPGDREALAPALPAAAARFVGATLSLDLDRLRRLLADEAADLGELPPDLERLFDEVSGRERRNLREERTTQEAEIARAVHEGLAEGLAVAERCGAGDDGTFAAFSEELSAAARAGRGELAGIGRGQGAPGAREAARLLAGAFVLARDPGSTGLRLDDLSRRLCGHTKALRPDTEGYARLADAVFERDPAARAVVEELAPGSQASRRRLALEALGLCVNEALLDVLVQGPVSLELPGGLTLDDPVRLATAGLPAKLTFGAIRRASSVGGELALVTTVENEGAFHRLAAARAPGELVVWTAGQAPFAVISLLRGLARSLPSLRFRHTGDLDRAGLLILRSLRRRTGLPVEPAWMEAGLFRRCAAVSLPLARGEHDEVGRTLAGWDEPYGEELLRALHEERRWVEQEAVVDLLLG